MKTKKFCPLNNCPKLPFVSSLDENYDFDTQYSYTNVAWHVYWKMCRRLMSKHKINIWEAHNKMQRDFCVVDFKTEGKVWKSDERLINFMLQFEDWQTKKYDLDKLHTDNNSVRHMANLIQPNTPLEHAFALCNDGYRQDFVADLWCRKLVGLLEQIVDDPIFGDEAKYELSNIALSEQWKKEEIEYVEKLPKNVKEIDEIIKKLGPSNYHVKFPYPMNQFHSVPNCLCVTADGSPIFRLEVLDPDECTKFRLAEVMPPWWKDSGLLEPCNPGEGEYDFPFYDCYVQDDTEFDLDKLFEVLNKGAEQISTRGERKWGIK